MVTTQAPPVSDVRNKTTDPGGPVRSPGDPYFNNWDEGRDLLIRFLEDFLLLLNYVVDERIVTDPSDSTAVYPFYNWNLIEAERLIDSVIADLRDDKKEEANLGLLQKFGLFGEAFWLKIREFYDSIPTRPLVAILEMGDVIMGSISKAFPILEPVKELKETIEVKLKHGGDKELITSLNISGREQRWNRTKKSD